MDSTLSAADVWFKKQDSRFSGQLLFGEPLSKHTYYRIGGPAAIFAVPKTIEDLEILAQGIAATGVKFFVLGAGSNLLVADQGYSGLVVRATRINLEITPRGLPSASGTLRVRTGGSVAVSTLLRRAATEGWEGLELLAGVPGSIGGVITMNAGTHLGEAKDRLRRVEAYSLLDPVWSAEVKVYEPQDFIFEYRRNRFLPQGGLIWAAEWEVTLSDPAKVKSLIDETLARRKATQPVEYPSCGSVFKNPRARGMQAWQVIDQLGLRGHTIGGAQFSEKHSNFIVNRGGAKADDVRGLISLAKTRALAELGVELEEEVMYLGD